MNWGQNTLMKHAKIKMPQQLGQEVIERLWAGDIKCNSNSGCHYHHFTHGVAENSTAGNPEQSRSHCNLNHLLNGATVTHQDASEQEEGTSRG